MNLWHMAGFVFGFTAVMCVPMVILMRLIIKQRQQERASMQDIEAAICRKK